VSGSDIAARLQHLWATPRSLWGSLATVHQYNVGLRYLATSIVLLMLGGIETLLLRVQSMKPGARAPRRRQLWGAGLRALAAYLQSLRWRLICTCIQTLSALVICGASFAGEGCVEVLVSNEASGDIAIVDPRSASVIAKVPVGKRPRGMALSPDREQLFVALSGSPVARPNADGTSLPPPDKRTDGIGVVDLTTRQLVRTITGVSDPERVAVSSDGKRLFVASEDQGLVVMFDANSGALLARTHVGAKAAGVDLNQGGLRVYATSKAENQVTILDANSAAALSHISVGLRPRSTSFSPDGLRAYVANEAIPGISVIDTASLRVVRTIALPAGMSPVRIAVPPAGSPLYVSTGSGREILAIDTRSGRVTTRAVSGARPWDLAIRPDGTELYVSNGPSNDLSVFTLPKLELRKRVHTGENPWGVVCRDNWWTHEGLGAPASKSP